METKDKNINSVINIEIPDSVDNAIKNATDKPSLEIGETLGDCLYLVFGGIRQRAAKKRAAYAVDLQQFKTELDNKVNKIPEDKRIEPDIQVVCTALDNMKYCVEVPELRDMFSTLIANSVNEELYNNVHPSYGEIIKQLTAFDANLIVWLKNQEVIPAIRFRIQVNNINEYKDIPAIYLVDDFGNHEKLQIAIENLLRLKIIDLQFDDGYADEHIYDEIKKNKEYVKDLDYLNENIGEDKKVIDRLGAIVVTHFGYDFMKACCQ